jgi:hypothetical protein
MRAITIRHREHGQFDTTLLPSERNPFAGQDTAMLCLDRKCKCWAELGQISTIAPK